MSENSSKTPAFEAACGRLDSATSLLLITHARPDGDGLGSMAALCRAAQAAGKTVFMLIPDDLPVSYGYLFPMDRPAGLSRFDTLAAKADTIVILDTSAAAQLDGLGEKLAARRDDVVVLDHHATSEDIAAIQCVDTTAAATAILVTELLTALGWAVDRQTADALAVGMLTDTGWLRFSNTDPRCLRAVADLVAKGVRPDVLYQRIYQNDRPERLALQARVLGSLELHAEGRVAAMAVRLDDFAATGARGEETENMINEALRLATVEVALMFTQNAEGTRVSLRSRQVVDVAKVAEGFGGGGHPRAAGLRLDEGVDAAKDRIIRACCQALDHADRPAR